MSKSFELMQPVGPAAEYASTATVTAILPTLEKVYRPSSTKRRAGEEVLHLVQRLFLSDAQAPPRVVVFAGIDHGNGCSEIAAAVAEILAMHSSRPVCLVEGNFRTPNLASLFGGTNHQGLTESLISDGDIRSFALPMENENLWLLSSGTVSPESPNLLTSHCLRTRISELRSIYGFVIIDAPPLNSYFDAIALAQAADGMVLIIEADTTRRDAAAAAATSLRSASIPILGAVLNKRTFPIPEPIYKNL